VDRTSWENIQSEVISAYGIGHLSTLQKLETLGLFVKRENENQIASMISSIVSNEKERKAKTTWRDLKSELKLVQQFSPDQKDSSPESQASSAYSGYIPLTARLVQRAVSSSWSTDKSLVNYCKTVFEIRTDDHKYQTELPLIIAFVGGVTRGEISAVRAFVEKRKAPVIIAATSIIKGDSFMEYLCGA